MYESSLKDYVRKLEFLIVSKKINPLCSNMQTEKWACRGLPRKGKKIML